MERSHTCPKCCLILKSKGDFETHIHVNYPNAIIGIIACSTHGNFQLIRGLEHFEMHYTKVFVIFLWNIIVIELAKLLVFRGNKALVSCGTATNYPKAWWQIKQIFYRNCKECIRIICERL